jgi:hypothetical protein
MIYDKVIKVGLNGIVPGEVADQPFITCVIVTRHFAGVATILSGRGEGADQSFILSKTATRQFTCVDYCSSK